jgi:hypothetical protein
MFDRWMESHGVSNEFTLASMTGRTTESASISNTGLGHRSDANSQGRSGGRGQCADCRLLLDCNSRSVGRAGAASLLGREFRPTGHSNASTTRGSEQRLTIQFDACLPQEGGVDAEAIEAISEFNHDLLRPNAAAPTGGRKKRA